MRSCTNRELRLAFYSFFAGAIVASVLWQYHLDNRYRPKPSARRRCPPPEPRPPEDCPPCVTCPRLDCTRCTDERNGPAPVPKTLKSFLARHWDVMHKNPVVIAKTRMKSVPSFIVSLYPSEKDPEISHHLIERGGWNEELIVRICREMKKAPTEAYFVDVGAYVGTLSLGVVACGHHAMAYEAMPTNAFLLKESVFLNQWTSERLSVYNMALGKTSGNACFLASSGNQGDGRFVSGGGEGYQCGIHETAVEMARLDEVIPEEARVWTLHVDAQGLEAAVLTGSDRLLTGSNPPRYLHVRLGTPYGDGVREGVRELADTLFWLKDIGYALRDADNEPIRDVDSFVWHLGHEEVYMTGIHGVK